MRRGIGLRGYAQQDPLNEFRKEAFRLYEELCGPHPPPGRDDDLPGHRHARAGDGAAARARPAGPRPGAHACRRFGRTHGRARRDAGNGSRRRSAPARRRGLGARRRRGDGRPRRRARTATGPGARDRAARRPDAHRARGAGRRGGDERRPARASPRRAPGSGATTRAGAGRARSTRSVTGPDRPDRRRRSCARSSSPASSSPPSRRRSPRVRIWQQGDRDEQRPADAIVVLGAAQYDGRPSPVFEARLDHAIACTGRASRRNLVVTGGKRPGDRTTEAAVARRYAIDARRARGGDLRRGRGRTTRSTRCAPSPARCSERGLRPRGVRLRPDPHAAGPADRARPRASRRTARRPRPRPSSATRSAWPGRRSTSWARSPSTS